jgi:hypothetical protein
LRKRDEARRPWGGRIVWSIVLLGIPLIFWAEYSIGLQSYRFWKYGVAKQALVIGLDHSDFGYRGGTTYWYKIDFDGKEIVSPFRVRLPEGNYVPILILPTETSAVTIGSKSSNLFEIYAYSMGGKVIGVLVLCSCAFFTCFSPVLIWQMLSKRRIFFAY